MGRSKQEYTINPLAVIFFGVSGLMCVAAYVADLSKLPGDGIAAVSLICWAVGAAIEFFLGD